MIINSNEKCPVCDRNFTDEDDIVICPHCGTPHHKECYKTLGHCFNSDKHSEGFDYSSTKSNGSENPSYENAGAYGFGDSYVKEGEYYHPPVQEERRTVCSRCGAEINRDAPFCSQCGARQSGAQYKEYSPLNDFGFNNATQHKYEGDTQTIDGKSLSDVAAVVRTNTEKFIPKFLKNKKISWNWSAFIFGPYYLLYRKMYKQGFVFFALSLITSLVTRGLFAEKVAAFSSFFSSNYQALYTNPSNELMNQLMEIYYQILPMMLILFGVNLILRIIIALFANSFYRAKTLEVLDKVDKILAEGDSLSSTIPIMEDTTLSQDYKRKLYLGKLGGTSILAPIIAYLALDLITTFISRI